MNSSSKLAAFSGYIIIEKEWVVFFRIILYAIPLNGTCLKQLLESALLMHINNL